MFSLIFLIANISAISQTIKTDKNCGCDYLNICNYTATRTYNGQKYYGVDGSEKNGHYYRCENGVITLLSVWQVDVDGGRSYDYNPFTNTETTTQYIDQENRYSTQTILKYNLPVGGKWQDSKSKWQWEVIEKNLTYNYKGKKYHDVIKVRATYGENYTLSEYLNGNGYTRLFAHYLNGRVIEKSSDKYWARSIGFIHSEDSFDSILLSVKNKPVNNLPNLSNQQLEKFILAQWTGFYTPVSKDGIDIPDAKLGEIINYLEVNADNGILFKTGKFTNFKREMEYSTPCAGKLNVSGSAHNFTSTITDCFGEKTFPIIFQYKRANTSSSNRSSVDRYKQIILDGITYESTNYDERVKVSYKYNPTEMKRKRDSAFTSESAFMAELGKPASILNDMQKNGVIDPSLIGIWMDKWEGRSMNPIVFYHLYSDGTYYYHQHSNRKNRIPDAEDKGIWRVMNGSLQLFVPRDKHIIGYETKADVFPLESKQENGIEYLKLHGKFYRKMSEKEYKNSW